MIHTDSVSPVGEKSGTRKCSIDKQDISRNSIGCSRCVDKFEVVLFTVSIFSEKKITKNYLSSDSSIRNCGVVIGREIVVSPTRSVRCRVGTSLA